MASVPSNTLAPHPPYFGNAQVMMIDPATIAIGERIGMFWPSKAEALGKLIAEDGQRDPIKVVKNGPRAKQPWTLVAGLHRLEGCKAEGLSVAVIEILDANPQTLMDIQASENLHRRALGPIERACFVRAIADVAEARMQAGHDGLTQQQIAVRKRWENQRVSAIIPDDKMADIEADSTAANFAAVYGWQEEVARSIGLSARTIRDDLALHRAIVAPFPDLAEQLAKRDVEVNASALREIIAIKSESVRRAVIVDLLAYPALTVAEAKERAGIRMAKAQPAEGATKYMNHAKSNLGRLSAADQRSIAEELAEVIKPSALVAVRDALNARIAAEGSDAGEGA